MNTSNLQRRWAGGGFALTAQLPPLMKASAGAFVEQMATQISRFDAVLTVESPVGTVGLSSLAMAVLLRRAGVETVAQMSGRDRNRLALQSDMLSLSVLGIPNLLIDTRTPVRKSLGQNPDARLVVDLYGPALLAAAARLRDEARFTSGASIKTPPVYYLGALVALEDCPDYEALRAAQFLVTTALHDALHLADTLASYCTSHADLLQTRPLLVSLPLTNGSQEASHGERDAFEARVQSMVAAVETLKMCEGEQGIRGCNIVLESLADLAVFERVVCALASHSATRE